MPIKKRPEHEGPIQLGNLKTRRNPCSTQVYTGLYRNVQETNGFIIYIYISLYNIITTLRKFGNIWNIHEYSGKPETGTSIKWKTLCPATPPSIKEKHQPYKTRSNNHFIDPHHQDPWGFNFIGLPPPKHHTTQRQMPPYTSPTSQGF